MQILDEVSLDTIIDALEELKGDPKPKPVAKAPLKTAENQIKPKPASTLIENTDSEPRSNRSPESVWHLVLDQVRARRPLIISWLEVATPLSLENGTLSIGFPISHELAIDSLSQPNNRKFIEELLGEILASPCKIEFEQREDLRPAEVKSAGSQQVDPMEEFKNDPRIQKALEIFKAEIQSEA